MYDENSFRTWCLARFSLEKLFTCTNVSSRMRILSKWIKKVFEVIVHSAFWSVLSGEEKKSIRPGNPMLPTTDCSSGILSVLHHDRKVWLHWSRWGISWLNWEITPFEGVFLWFNWFTLKKRLRFVLRVWSLV